MILRFYEVHLLRFHSSSFLSRFHSSSFLFANLIPLNLKKVYKNSNSNALIARIARGHCMISLTSFVKLSPFFFHFLFGMFDFYMIFAFHCKAN